MSLHVQELGEETLAQAVARRVRGIMGERRISGSALARQLEQSQAAFSRRTTGMVAFSLDEISSIAELLGVTEAYLLGFSEVRNPRPVEDGGSDVVRHQGLEPRTRWLTLIAGLGGLVEDRLTPPEPKPAPRPVVVDQLAARRTRRAMRTAS